jgi:hypothetical protein
MAPTPALPRRISGHARRFAGLLADPRAVQERVLADVLARNAGCEYGRCHDFAALASSDDFRHRVPMASAESLRPSIARMAAGESGVLLSDRVVAFEETGGTGGGAKLVPYSQPALASFRAALLPWLDDLYQSRPGLAGGTAYWSVSPACREPRRTAGGVPIGLPSDAAYLGDDLAADLAATLGVPPAVGALRDADAWRRLTLHYLLADARLALVSVWSPTFLLELLRYAQENPASLARGIASGEHGVELAAQLREQLPATLPDARRARHVASILSAASPAYQALWPDLGLISCWDQATSRPYAEELRELFPGVVVQGKGLLATEGVVSIPFGAARMPVLALESGFYEFIGADGATRRADEVAEGGEYEILLTNHAGLYRYALGDRVRVAGFAGRTPMLEFIGRAGAVSDLCGEKITEAFALGVLRREGLRFAALAPEARDPRGYVLLLDAMEVSAPRAADLAARLDAALEADPQYAYARRLRQLAPLREMRCAHPLRSWIDAGLARGQRLGDIKPCALHVQGDWRRTFRPAP